MRKKDRNRKDPQQWDVLVSSVTFYGECSQNKPLNIRNTKAKEDSKI